MRTSTNRRTATAALGALAVAAAGLVTGAATGQGQVAKLLPSDALLDDRLGVADVDGDIAIAAAYQADPNGMTSGAVWVFARDQGGAGNWGEVKKLTPSDGAASDQFGFSAAISGDTIVVSSRGDDDNGASSGSVYIFQQDFGGTDNWGEVKKVTASDGAASDLFGNSVSIDGDTVIVGAWFGDDGATSDTGAAYIFERDQGGADNWGEVTKLDTTVPLDASDSFGWAVAISGDRAVVSAYQDDEVVGDAGAAYVFERDQGGADNWGEVTKLTASDGATFDWLGQSVAIDGDTVVIGARQDDDAEPGNINCSSGSAYVYDRDEGGVGNWGEVTKLLDPSGNCGDSFGGSVAVDGDVIAVGASGDDDAATSAGSGFVFVRDEGGTDSWGLISRFNAADADLNDSFGVVRLGGQLIAAAAPFDNESATAAGAAYVFSVTALVLSNADCNGNGVSDIVEFLTGAADCNGNGILDECDIANGTSLDGDMNGVPDECPTPCPADIDGDGSVNVVDLLALLAAWGACP